MVGAKTQVFLGMVKQGYSFPQAYSQVFLSPQTPSSINRVYQQSSSIQPVSQYSEQPTAMVTVPMGTSAHTYPGGETIVSYKTPSNTPVYTIPKEEKKGSLLNLYYGMSSYATAQILNPDIPVIIQHQLAGPLPQGNVFKDTDYWNKYVATDTEFQNQIKRQNYETYKNLWESKDILGLSGRAMSSPFVATFSSYGIGAGLGGFAMSKIGQTSLFKINLIRKGINVTPSLVANVGIGGVFTAQTLVSGKEAYEKGQLKEWGTGAGFLAPFVYYPFKWGYTKGMGYVQRTGAMSTVTDPFSRTQQQALYDLMKATEKLHEPYTKPSNYYDITKVKTLTPSQANKIGSFLGSPVNKIISKPAIGGSTAMDIQMGEYFRSGGQPSRLLEIAETRQLKSGTYKPLRTTGGPVDIDILLGSRFATEKMASRFGAELDTHVHVSKPNTYLWGGYSTKPFIKSTVKFPNKLIDIKTLSVKEQLFRYAISALPSETKQTGYRSFKDIPGLYDVTNVMQFQKGGMELQAAMDRYINYERYKSPKVSIGEKMIKRMGGAVQPEYVETYGGKFAEPVYPKEIYKKPYINAEFTRAFISRGYGQKTYKEPSLKLPYSLADKYKSIIPFKPDIIPIYKPRGFYTPSINIPPIITTPKYNPPYKPTIYEPPYKPTNYPNIIPPPSQPKLKTISGESFKKKIKKAQKSFLSTGYHFRKWKTPKISDLLKIKGW